MSQFSSCNAKSNLFNWSNSELFSFGFEIRPSLMRTPLAQIERKSTNLSKHWTSMGPILVDNELHITE
jgi:hypothetical protein